MLEKLSIRNIVLIDKLDLSFERGLCVLTGETGAGKSILLDSLALALGVRADAGLVRAGTDQGSVTAEFSLIPSHPVFSSLGDIDVEPGEPLILRRMLGSDGRSRASINDQAVSAGLLRNVGETLVEIHGQNAERGLLDARGHRALLDQYARLEKEVIVVGRHYETLQKANEKLERAVREIEQARVDEEYLRHIVEELSELAPEEGEEEALAVHRSNLMHAEKIAEALRDAEKALTEHGGVENRIRSATRAVERVIEKASGKLDPVLESLERAAIEMAEAQGVINSVAGDLDMDPVGLEVVEERLFALRAAARKHKCEVSALPKLLESFVARLKAVEEGDREIESLRAAAAEARKKYVAAASALSQKRKAAALDMDRAVMAELEPLKLGAATFTTDVSELPDENWGSHGFDKVAFLISTNPGSAAGPLIKIASGGELSRFMLALKVVLAQAGSAPTLIFDEVDRGVGGATADAVGDRLRRLAEDLQVLVVTHSPQVAAAGEAHWNIRKSEVNNATVTSVDRLDQEERTEEIARMLSGASITEEARAAALSLIEG
ncbi:DNA repair protein RecN [Sneathiella sp. HT1-7]|uniref:DNA repair protein RecN n=1 Tax=Sneathiella sp. HT1-7 TaxID=2887192 RepID=UPI001D14CEFF|nr:DNA repair protein RecN [Sneathiella sp. HT1-7]MCC3304527.1 DNA repair protein RecN [Sneathiella sp. HT1-7]